MTLFLMLVSACGRPEDPDPGVPDAAPSGCRDAEGQGPFAQRACVTASNPGDYHAFGAQVVLAGDTLVVSAPAEDSAATGIDGDPNDGSAGESGAVYVFRRMGSSLAQEHYIKASNTVRLAHFGESMALDRDTLVIGAPGESSAATGVNGDQADVSASESGAVYVFRRSGATWQQEAYIKASNTGGGVRDIEGFIQPGDYFGTSVALLGDTLVVGARFEDSAATGVDGDQADDSAGDSGAVYVFRRTGTTWQQEAYLKPSDTKAGSDFGRSVVLTEDTLAVGAPLRNGAGAVYVFRRSGSTWTQEAILEGAEVGEYDQLGGSLALVGDTLVAGAAGRPDDTGAAYVFRRTGSTWAQEATLQAPSPGPNDNFGYSVALAGDTLFVGAIGSFDVGGAVHVFRRAGALWQHEAEIEPLDSTPFDFFGSSLAVSEGALAVGASARDANDVAHSGALYLFDAP